MPSKKNIPLPDWIEDLDNPCLSAVARDAWVARLFALDMGADKARRGKPLVQEGNAKLDQARQIISVRMHPYEVREAAELLSYAHRRFVEAQHEMYEAPRANSVWNDNDES